MHQQAVIDYSLSKAGAEATFPFGPEVLVVKVLGKMFMLTAKGEPPRSISLKCDPMRAIALREQFPSVTPGYHLNKRHWNSIALDGTLTLDELQQLVDHSYDLVVKALPKAQRLMGVS